MSWKLGAQREVYFMDSLTCLFSKLPLMPVLGPSGLIYGFSSPFHFCPHQFLELHILCTIQVRHVFAAEESGHKLWPQNGLYFIHLTWCMEVSDLYSLFPLQHLHSYQHTYLNTTRIYLNTTRIYLNTMLISCLFFALTLSTLLSCSQAFPPTSYCRPLKKT